MNISLRLFPFASLRASFLWYMIVLFSPVPLYPQTEAESELERILEETTREEDVDPGLIDLIERYRKEPLYLYNATVDDLAELPGISPQTAARIIDFLRTDSPSTFDAFSSLNWLSVEGEQVLRALTTLVPPPHIPGRQLHVQFRGRVTREVQERRGFSESQYRIIERKQPSGDSLVSDTIELGSRYVGSPEGILTRLLIDYGEYAGGITFEKDPGETIFHSDTTGFSYENYERVEEGQLLSGDRTLSRLGSFVGFHARGEWKSATLYLGDYTASFGQGLIFGKNFGGRKGTAPTRDPYNGGGGLRSYRSAGERFFFRGAGVHLQGGDFLPSRLELTAFASMRRLDASVGERIDERGDTLTVVTSIREDGLLQTRTDLRRAGTLNERIVGGHLRGRIGDGETGLTVAAGRYDIPVNGTLTNSEEREIWDLIGVDFDIPFPSGRAFGEIALSDGGAPSGIAGAALRLQGADLTVALRSYHSDFFSPYGLPFGESPVNPRNEQGIYFGLRTRLFRRTYLSLYGDFYRLPDGNADYPLPVTGVDGMLLLQSGITPEFDLELRLKGETRGVSARAQNLSGREVTRILERVIAGGRLTMRWTPRRGPVELRARAEGNVARYSEILPDENGLLTYLDLRWRPAPTLSFGTRLVLFGTDGSNVRLYEFEQDIPGSLSNVVLSGEGRRFYLLAEWQPTRSLGLALRYGETWYADRETISSGSLQEIEGQAVGKLSLQVDWRFASHGEE